jgi:hypothetical protein
MVRNAIPHQQSGFASNSDNKWQQAGLWSRSHIRRWLTRRFGPAGPLALLDSCRAYPGFSIQHLPIRLVHRRMGRAIHRPEDLGC